MSETRHVTAIIDRPANEVYDFARDPKNLPRWASGLGGTDVQHEVEHWSMNTPMGRVLISFVPENPYGVLDHSVTLPSGESTLNPMRVIPLDEQRSEVVFTLRRGTMADEEFAADAEAVAEDLAELKQILEQA
ncbi:SRPBCC family protein [Brachybacterium sp. p3-SID1565]|uniref:SRPBCC family protein n=1 Tax=Brachybacterium sp. p3-SID1565 TaxID=2916046 RepID=UPI0021A7F9DE|nr:SRPBCC family protein [Brachybacterium sp. p3-SID1565]MCT1386156.1 SRPBCC family protein [Brachybacterium sp. p3-SID1565]